MCARFSEATTLIYQKKRKKVKYLFSQSSNVYYFLIENDQYLHVVMTEI